MACSTLTTLSIVLVLLSSYLVPTTSDCSVLDETYYVVHKATGRAISGYTRNDEVGLPPLDTSYVASFYNTWIMYLAPKPGLFFITIKCCMIGVVGLNRTTNELEIGYNSDSIYQQWFFNDDGRIYNAGMFNHGMRVNRTEIGQVDLYVGPMEDSTDDDIFEFIVSQW